MVVAAVSAGLLYPAAGEAFAVGGSKDEPGARWEPWELNGKQAADKYRGSSKGKAYRGDSRDPDKVFKEGFKSQGSDGNLDNHLSFRGNSGYVSTSLDKGAAQRYSFGRSSDPAHESGKGYLYKVDLSRVDQKMYDVYGRHGGKDPAAKFNRELAVRGEIPSSAIKGAYEVDRKSGLGKEVKNPNYRCKRSVDACSVAPQEIDDTAVVDRNLGSFDASVIGDEVGQSGLPSRAGAALEGRPGRYLGKVGAGAGAVFSGLSLADDIKNKDSVNAGFDGAGLGLQAAALAFPPAEGAVIAEQAAQALYNYVDGIHTWNKKVDEDHDTWDSAADGLTKRFESEWKSALDTWLKDQAVPTVRSALESKYKADQSTVNDKVRHRLDQIDIETQRAIDQGRPASEVLNEAEAQKAQVRAEAESYLAKRAEEYGKKIPELVEQSINSATQPIQKGGSGAYEKFAQNFTDKVATPYLSGIQDKLGLDEVSLHQAWAPWQVNHNWSAQQTSSYVAEAKHELEAKQAELREDLLKIRPEPVDTSEKLSAVLTGASLPEAPRLGIEPDVYEQPSVEESVTRNAAENRPTYRAVVDGGRGGSVVFSDKLPDNVNSMAVADLLAKYPQYKQLPAGAYGSLGQLAGKKVDIFELGLTPSGELKEQGNKKELRDLPELGAAQVNSLASANDGSDAALSTTATTTTATTDADPDLAVQPQQQLAAGQADSDESGDQKSRQKRHLAEQATPVYDRLVAEYQRNGAAETVETVSQSSEEQARLGELKNEDNVSSDDVPTDDAPSGNASSDNVPTDNAPSDNAPSDNASSDNASSPSTGSEVADDPAGRAAAGDPAGLSGDAATDAVDSTARSADDSSAPADAESVSQASEEAAQELASAQTLGDEAESGLDHDV
ncbi:hypothetical protein ACH429_06295 [Streptomyces pathocidini]|uniref:Pierisin-like domain-containing protein n=1 Tax=Streptomyces pathocidini TaxID=1650571 RepID=A0ABW7UPE3_9ACTN|nr:hypothetical protein [Streptomyces pathocidini]